MPALSYAVELSLTGTTLWDALLPAWLGTVAAWCCLKTINVWATGLISSSFSPHLMSSLIFPSPTPPTHPSSPHPPLSLAQPESARKPNVGDIKASLTPSAPPISHSSWSLMEPSGLMPPSSSDTFATTSPPSPTPHQHRETFTFVPSVKSPSPSKDTTPTSQLWAFNTPGLTHVLLHPESLSFSFPPLLSSLPSFFTVIFHFLLLVFLPISTVICSHLYSDLLTLLCWFSPVCI